MQRSVGRSQQNVRMRSMCDHSTMYAQTLCILRGGTIMRRLFTVLPKPKHTRSVVLVLTRVYAYTGACDNGSRNFPQATLTDLFLRCL